MKISSIESQSSFLLTVGNQTAKVYGLTPTSWLVVYNADGVNFEFINSPNPNMVIEVIKEQLKNLEGK